MRKLIVNEFVSMDGVAQAHGGWHMHHAQDERVRAWVMKYIAEIGALVLGRRTYEIFAGYWPNAPEENAVAEPLNRLPKYVASTTLTEPLAWDNSSLLRPDVATALRALKHEDGRDLHVIGSARNRDQPPRDGAAERPDRERGSHRHRGPAPRQRLTRPMPSRPETDSLRPVSTSSSEGG